jgi:hypothetical protein
MNSLRNIGLIFWSPSRVARNVAESPNWIIPLVVVVVLVFVTTYATYSYNMEYQRQVFDEIQQRSARQIDGGNYFAVTTGKRVFAGSVAGAGIAVAMLVGAAIIHGLALVLGGRSSFRKMFTFNAYAWIILAVGGLVKVPLIFAKKSIDVRTSLAALTPGIKFDSPLGVFLNSIDVFYLWMLVAAIIGYGILSELGSRKSTVIMVVLYVLFLVFSVGTTLLRKKVMG